MFVIFVVAVFEDLSCKAATEQLYSRSIVIVKAQWVEIVIDKLDATIVNKVWHTLWIGTCSISHNVFLLPLLAVNVLGSC